MKYSKSLQKYLPPSFLASTLFIVYLQTMATGLTWANSGPDGGDLITAAATGGIAHPTGYPVYLLLARAFQLLPIGSLAYRTNLMSAAVTVFAAVLVYAVVTRFLSHGKAAQNWLPGIVAGYAFGLAPVVWSQAVITEVYALQALFVTLILFLAIYSTPSFNAQKNLDRLRGGILGLAMSNHITVIFLVSMALLAGALERRSPADDVSPLKKRWFSSYRLNWLSLKRQIVWVAAGLLVYLILPLRAFTNPAINWGNPVTLEGFWWLVSGRLYQSHYLQIAPAGLWNRIQAMAVLFLEQFGILGLFVGLIGLIVFFKPSRLYLITAWIGASFSIFTLGYRTEDSYVYLIPAFISFSIWIGLGVGNLTAEFQHRFRSIAVWLGLLFLVYIGALAFIHGPVVDASHDHRAEDFGRQVLSAAPVDAIVFAKGDRAIFTMWYFHFALGERPDLVVLASDLLKYDWYQEMARSEYPALVLADGFPWPGRIMDDNPHRSACYVEYDWQADIRCEYPSP